MKIAVVPTVLAVGIACASLAQAGTGADTSNLDQIVAGVYNQVQRGCRHRHHRRSNASSGTAGSPYGGGGTGRIIDANPHLGGPFQVLWNLGPNAPNGYRSVPAQPQGYWDINLEFC